MYFKLVIRALPHINFNIDLHLQEYPHNIPRYHIVDEKGLFSFRAVASLKRRQNIARRPVNIIDKQKEIEK